MLAQIKVVGRTGTGAHSGEEDKCVLMYEWMDAEKNSILGNIVSVASCQAGEIYLNNKRGI